MNPSIKISQIVIAILVAFQSQFGIAQQNEKVEIMLVGFAHLNQMQNGTEAASMFSPKKQQELEKITAKIAQFKPDAIMVELTRHEKKTTDSLYKLYQNNQLDLKDFENGASETYQVGFRLANKLNLDHVYGIDFKSATSQRLLKEGDHFEYFQEQLKKLQQIARPLGKQVVENSLSLYDFTKKINEPEMLDLSYRAIFNFPAYVQNGDFDKEGINYRDLNSEEKKYAGAEYISLFFDRNIKIYSNILNTQLKTGSKRIYVMMGQAHIGILKNLLKDNPNYKIVDALAYLD
ncbi:DUF5694 domain-containing protein [Zunongwangia pacifica]|uniref:DUF5694 domain-containing protein n=1 Tax=Zunongwangia pacifica TaxID=2911062 RepID=A0A9X1ZTB3_9FLAO|nr:DUF5694 domain-containing protein [Zunongwangia pacifica]MCL6217250.1 DUF5694 domain-containing protein [Zunongwangia pacifica]